MKITKEQAKKVQNSPECTVWEYHIESDMMSFATALIDGRYPEKGRVVNEGCEEIYFVISGEGIVHSEKGDFQLKRGDIYSFEKSEKYWVEGDNFKIALFNAPKWTLNQHKNID